MNWYTEVLKKYAVFHGRARRKEYWYFTLFFAIFYLGLEILASLIGDEAADVIPVIYVLAVALPAIAVSVRRLHDTDRSGWFVLLSLIPLVGTIILIVFCAQDSTPGENQYGPNPKDENAAVDDYNNRIRRETDQKPRDNQTEQAEVEEKTRSIIVTSEFVMQLEKISKLHIANFLTDEEYQSEKRTLILSLVKNPLQESKEDFFAALVPSIEKGYLSPEEVSQIKELLL